MATIILLLKTKFGRETNKSKSKRYIETIKEENKDINLTENLVVIYLSLDREEPTDCSLGDFKVAG